MFPAHLRKSPESLQQLSENIFRKWLTSLIKGPSDRFWSSVSNNRVQIRRRLSAEVRTLFLASLVPSDRWSRPCLASSDRVRCFQHEDCRLVYENCDKIIELLAAPDLTSIKLNLKRIMQELHRKIFDRIAKVIYQVDILGSSNPLLSPHCPRLSSLILSGGSSHTDKLVRKIDRICQELSQHAPGLKWLHLPVMSNDSVKHLSTMASLICLRSDRTKDFDELGLRFLSADSSATRHHLQFFHIGVYKHRRFDKLDVARFFVQMSALKNISFMDDNRALVQVTEQFGHVGDKVLVYSVLRLAIISAYSGNLKKMTRITADGHYTYSCNLVEILVVDREMKPKYLLESCPHLKRLSLEWQHDLSQPPYHQYHPEWFARMLLTPEWTELNLKLTHLSIKFPSSDNPLGYCLPLSDFSRLLSNCSNLSSLKLMGVGRNGDPVPVLHILSACPQLQELHLEKCRIYLPDVYQHFEKSVVHLNLRRFRFLSDHLSLKWHPFLTRCIAVYMPKLVELEIQPQAASEFEGYPLERLIELSPMSDLVRLSLPLSLNSCIMNMPEVVIILTEFVSLRQLVLSWGIWNLSNMTGRIQYLLSWLKNALKAENANICVQLDFTRHPSLYQFNPSRMCWLPLTFSSRLLCNFSLLNEMRDETD